jgi:UDP-4-amino-4,6-dideoxy-N-acetyl-beta-L-altrosamine transaminase
MIPYSCQDIDQDDIDAVVRTLRSSFITQGPMVPLFEKTVAGYCGTDYGVATSNASAALHIACLALNLGPGDTLWTSPNSFVASANCALHCGAKIDFVDIDKDTYNISIKRLTEKLVQAEKDGKLPKIVVPVHFCGQSCDMEAIYELSQQYGFKIIEDASHAIGAKYKNKPIGNCLYSDITVFSFHPVKIITTGEGGMALTNNPELAERLQFYRSHGITNDSKNMSARPVDEIWNYQQITLGLNYRMTDIHAALGVSQMKRLEEFVSLRRKVAHNYNNLLKNLPLQIPFQSEDSYSSYHLYPIRINLNESKQTQRQIYNALHSADILVNIHYIPIYRQPYFESIGFKAGYCPESEQYHKEVLSIPIYPKLSMEQQTYIVETLKLVLTSKTL